MRRGKWGGSEERGGEVGEERNLSTQSAVLHGFCVHVTLHPRGTTLASGNSAVPAVVVW